MNHVSHRNLTAFLRDWLYGDTIPPMPGHPDWTADPVTAAPLRAGALGSLAVGTAQLLEHR